MRHGKFLVSLPLAIILASLAVFAAGSLNSPAACNGEWSNCNRAFANDASRATANPTATDTESGVWKNYSFSIPSSASIDSVIVRADFFASNVRGFVDLKVSGDNGTSYGASHIFGGNTAEQTFLIDVTGDLSWTPGMLSNGNLHVNATCFKNGTGTNPVCRLDWIPVNVTYTPFDFSVSASPSSDTVSQGASKVTTVTVTKLSGGSATVNLAYSGCPTDAVCSFDPSSGNPTYASDFTVDTADTTPTGTYVITINGTGDGKSRTATYTLNVTDSQPVADATADPTSGVEPLNVSFTGGVTGGNAPFTYFWDFADGTNSTQQNPTHTFSAGTYNVFFTAVDNDGDDSTDNVTITVSGDDQPVASASANPASGYVSLAVSFTGGVTGGNAPFTYFWDFADGTNSTSQNPLHTYTSTGVFEAEFTVTDNDGDSSSDSVNVTVGDFSVSVNPSNATVPRGNTTNTTVTVTLLSGVSNTVTLSHQGCPAGANCSFTVLSGSPTYQSTFSFKPNSTMSTGTYNINITGTGNGNTRKDVFTVTVV